MVLMGKSVKLKEKQIDNLKQIGEQKDRNFSSLVRKAIDEYIEKNKDLINKNI